MIEKRLPYSSKSTNPYLILEEKELRKKNGITSERFYKTFDFWLIAATFAISLFAFLFFFFSGHKNLADYDAIARLNISRKIIDSITPGFAQLGGIWLPFPQVLFLPFIWNGFLWHTGIAGAIVSMSAFVASAYFLYKTVLLITNSRIGGILAWFVYVSNVNMLFLQSMAMSESFFLFTLVMILYFLTKWAKTKSVLDLLYCALFVILTTLTRYEGYALFGAASLSVVAVMLATFSKKERQNVEGTLVLFMTMASFGILLWSFYSFLIFKDPIYWLNLYRGNKAVIALDSTATSAARGIGAVSEGHKVVSLLDSFKIYTSSMFFMNGIIVSVLASLAFITLSVKSFFDIAKRHLEVLSMPIIIMTFCVFAFLIFGYWQGLIPNIETPYVNVANLTDKRANFFGSSNIRYGIITLPLMALVIGAVYSRIKIFSYVVIFLVLFQIYAIFATPLMLTFSIPKKMQYTEFEYARWFKENYEGGLILVSAHRHENFILQTGIDYENFIYEGTRQWWRNSLTNPSQHATWVVLDENISGDAVNELMTGRDILESDFEVVHQEGSLKIYKKRY